MTLDLAVIKGRAEKYAKAIGPGGEKAWLAGVLAADVPTLLAALAAVEQDRDNLSALAAEQTVELELKTAALQRIHNLPDLPPAGRTIAGDALRSGAEAGR